MRTSRIFMVLSLLLFAWISNSAAQEQAPGLTISKMVFCEDVENKEPVGEATTFSSDTEKVYCFIRVEGAEDETEVTARWYYKDKLMAEVALPVRSKSWRTWSSKRLQPSWVGEWHVQIVDEGGEVLRDESFQVE